MRDESSVDKKTLLLLFLLLSRLLVHMQNERGRETSSSLLYPPRKSLLNPIHTLYSLLVIVLDPFFLTHFRLPHKNAHTSLCRPELNRSGDLRGGYIPVWTLF